MRSAVAAARGASCCRACAPCQPRSRAFFCSPPAFVCSPLQTPPSARAGPSPLPSCPCCLQSVLNGAASLQDQHPQLSSCRRHALEVEDSKEANLLSSLPAAVGFITAALEGGGGSARVLVHCAQGVSRSAAVAAAYLMAASAGAAGGGPGGLDPDAALAALRRVCPAAAPNAGFVAQLELFHAMGCRMQDGYVPYKRFLLQQASGRPRPRCGDLPRARSAGPRCVGPACCGMRGVLQRACKLSSQRPMAGSSTSLPSLQVLHLPCHWVPPPSCRPQTTTKRQVPCPPQRRCRCRPSPPAAARPCTAAASAAAWWLPATTWWRQSR